MRDSCYLEGNGPYSGSYMSLQMDWWIMGAEFHVVFTNDCMHMLHTTVTYFNVVLVEYTMELVMLREMVVD